MLWYFVFNLHICCIIYMAGALLQSSIRVTLPALSLSHTLNRPISLSHTHSLALSDLNLKWIEQLFIRMGQPPAELTFVIFTQFILLPMIKANSTIGCSICWYYLLVPLQYFCARFLVCLSVCLLVERLARRWVLVNRIYLSIKLSLHYGHCPCSCCQ